MEDKNNGVLPSLADTETESTRYVADEDAVVKGGGVSGRIDGEQGGEKAESTVGKKRGRPMKHQVDEKATLPMVPEGTPAKPIQKRGRGRPRGSRKLQFLASLGGFAVGIAGGNFIPHAVTIQTGEGRFEIITLTGSYAYSEMGGVCRKIGMSSVSLAKPDGRVFGGTVAGSLIAAGPIQVSCWAVLFSIYQLILASFKQNMKKQLQRRHNAKSSTAVGTPTSDVEKNCVTPTSPLPETPHEEGETIINFQNTNHASDINGGVPEM